MTTTTIIILCALAYLVLIVPLAVLLGRTLRQADAIRERTDADIDRAIEAAIRRILDDADDDDEPDQPF